MTRPVTLDAEAFSALARRRSPQRAEVRRFVEAAIRLKRDVLVPAVVLAELYRGPGHNASVDACLASQSGIDVRDTDRSLARVVGTILAAAGAGSEDMADAHVVAVATEAGGGVILTGDPDDLERLAGRNPGIVVQAI